MSELPDEFDSKREMDGWLAVVIDKQGYDLSYYQRDSTIDLHEVNSRDYTTDREAALDLLEEFCEEYDLNCSLRIGLSSRHYPNFLITIYGCAVRSEGLYDPLTISVAIYRAFCQLEEGE